MLEFDTPVSGTQHLKRQVNVSGDPTIWTKKDRWIPLSGSITPLPLTERLL